MDRPLISVVIPTFNSQRYLREAIESVINQSYKNLQILILDDASDDKTVSLAKGFTDSRITVYESTENQGQSYQLNKGISKSTGEYVCIMHSDDVMHVNKLEQQLYFFQQNPLTGVCGCNVRLIGEKTGIWVYPKKNQDCKDLLLSSVPFAHPTVVYKRSLLQDIGLVYENIEAAEDFDLWVRLADKVHFGNVQEVLLDYRIHPMQVSNTKKEVEFAFVEEIRRKIITNLFKIENKDQAFICFKALYHQDEISIDDAVRGVILLWKSNKKHRLFSMLVLRGRLRHVLFKTLSNQRFKLRIKYLMKNPVLFEICIFKTLARILLTTRKFNTI